MIKIKKKNIEIGEKEREVISMITKLDETELFGLQCFVAGLHTQKSKESKKQEGK